MQTISRIITKLFIVLLALFACVNFHFSTVPAYAANDNCVPTSIVGDGQVCDTGNGDSVVNILNLVVDIMTIGVGILGVVGISIVGVQYLTAGGSEEKVTKSKRRMFEIIIGLAVYAVIFALLKWILPNFTP